MMSWIRAAGAELVGLFVDDGSFASAILAWLAGGYACVHYFALPRDVEGIILAVGFAWLLAENVTRTAQNSRGQRP